MKSAVSGRSGARLGLLALCVALCLPRAALAQGDNADDLARRHFESGVAYLEESDYDNALRAFQKAYDLSKRPEILINIATVQERRADIDGAIVALRQYLEVAPNGEHAETVRLRVQNLEKRRPAPVPPEPKPEVTPPPPPPPPPPPVVELRPNRVPAFIALGVGAAAGIGAFVTGIVAKNKYDDAKLSCSPHCTDSQLSSSRGFALTSTILTGAAVLGAGVGVTLLVLGKPTESKSTAELVILPSVGGAAARASWRF
ncbi:MAG TPA: hypothetical protein VFQ35_28565 [Polyangiaceae bacterium]|nr:hypothetical protein [Polyangiaceae bacterium]